MLEKKLESNQMYAVAISGLQMGCVMSFAYKKKREYNYTTGKYEEAHMTTVAVPIHKVIHNNGRSVTLKQTVERPNRRYYDNKTMDISYTVGLDTVVTILEIPNAN